MTAVAHDTRLIDLFDLSDEFLMLLHREGVRTVAEALWMFERRRHMYRPPSAASVLFELTFFKGEWDACEAAVRVIQESQDFEGASK